jgi:hypothetical protein
MIFAVKIENKTRMKGIYIPFRNGKLGEDLASDQENRDIKQNGRVLIERILNGEFDVIRFKFSNKFDGQTAIVDDVKDPNRKFEFFYSILFQ